MSFPFTRATLDQCIARKSKNNPQGMTLPQLREEAQRLGLSTTGNKSDLCLRIIESLESSTNKGTTKAPVVPSTKLSLPLPQPMVKQLLPKPRPVVPDFNQATFAEVVGELIDQGYTQIMATFWCCQGTASDKLWVMLRKPGTTTTFDRATIWGSIKGPYQSKPGPHSPPITDAKLVEQKYGKGYEHSPELYKLVQHLVGSGKPDLTVGPSAAEIRRTQGRFVYPSETILVKKQLTVSPGGNSDSDSGRGITMTREIRMIESPPQGCVLGKQGRRSSMEDTHVVATAGTGDGEVSFYGVFDGHGGRQTAIDLEKDLADLLAEKLAEAKVDLTRPSQVRPVIKDTYKDMDQKLADRDETSGSTAVAVLRVGDLLYFINLGDSRAVLVSEGNVLHATEDHKPGDPKEVARIEAAGGFVQKGWGPARVNGILAVSRAFGDNVYGLKFDENRQYGGFNAPVSPEPTITTYQMDPGQSAILVLACDGLWDVFSNKEIAELVPVHGSLVGVCEMLIDQAIDERNSGDNVSVMVVPVKAISV